MCTGSPRRNRAEGGYTVLEVMVVVMFMAIFALAVQTSLDAFVRTTRLTEDKTSVVADVRVAEEAVAKELRAANPIDDIAPAPVTDYLNKVGFSVFCSTPGVDDCGADGLRKVTFRLRENRFEQVVGNQVRVLVGPDGRAAVPAAQRVGAVINSPADPIFTYLDRTGQPFDIQGTAQSVSTRRVHDCTKAVQIHIKVMSEPKKPATAYNLITTVELRNFNEVSGC